MSVNLNHLSTTAIGSSAGAKGFKGHSLEMNSVTIGLPAELSVNNSEDSKRLKREVSRVKSGNSTRPGTAISARASAVSVDADPASDAISGEFSLATTSNFNTRGTAAMLTTIANTGVGGIISGVDMHVLQQRIEALELEKQILASSTIRQTQAEDSDFREISLDAYIQSFKIKYASLSQRHEEVVKSLETRNAALAQENQVVTKQSQRDSEERGAMQIKITTLERTLSRYRDESGQRELQLAAKLEKMTQLLINKEKQYQGLVESSGLEIQKQRTSVGQMREETAERDRRISDLATKVTSMENAATDAAVIVLNASSEVESKKSIAVALDKELCEHKVLLRKADLHAKLSQGAIDTLTLSNTSFAEDNARLEARLVAQQVQLLDRSTEAFTIQLVTAQRCTKDATDALASSTLLLCEKSSRMDSMREQRVMLETRCDSIAGELSTARQRIVELEKEDILLSESKTKFEQTSLMQSEELSSLKSRVASMTDELELVQLERDDLQSELISARARLDTGGAMQQLLKLDQFQGMMRANLEVADSIKSLMSKLDVERQPALPLMSSFSLPVTGGGLMSALSASISGTPAVPNVAQFDREERIRKLKDKIHSSKPTSTS